MGTKVKSFIAVFFYHFSCLGITKVPIGSYFVIGYSQVARPYKYEIPVVVFFIDEYDSSDPILHTFYGYPSGTLEQFLEFHP